MKRTEMKRSSTPVNPKSDKRKAEDRLRAVVLERLRRERGRCEAECVRHCTGEPQDGHEIHTRGRGGSITDENNILMVCRPCHDEITLNPAWAHMAGFVIHEWEATPEGFAEAKKKRVRFRT